ncbi:MAG: type II toxin-antitoxin system PemK/MazF family toxin [Desulfuromonadales bacterium]|nr:type II toxin-antitoxin system PemK/MazF family toxin [Desulfuromonadales bacterium]
MRRGEVWVANRNPGCGREIGKIRPVLVIQDDALTAAGAPMVIVLPLTTQVYPAFKHWRVTLEPRDRLLKPCQIVIDQPRAIDLARLGDGPLTSLHPEEMARVEKSLKAVLGLVG